MSTIIFGKTVTNAAEALRALRGACSTSKDDDGEYYVYHVIEASMGDEE